MVDLKARKLSLLGVLMGGVCLLPLSVRAQSQQVLGATSNITVQNAFTFTEAVVADVGISAVFTDIGGPDVSTITLAPNGSLTVSAPNNSQIIIVDQSGTTAGQFSISNAAPNTPMTINFFNVVDPTCAPCGGANPDILLGAFTHDAGGAPMTDGAGDLTFNYGFTLTTIPGPPQYLDGLYTGGFDISVSY